MTYQSFTRILDQWPITRVRKLIAQQQPADVKAALAETNRTPEALAALLSPHSRQMLESMAQTAAGLTRQRFGNIVQFYAPLYVSNYCCNSCLYCGFNCHSNVKRRALTIDEALADAAFLQKEGFQHILLVSGEDSAHASIDYFETLVHNLRDHFASISIEIYPLDYDGYKRLVNAGVDGLTLYQETYNQQIYKIMHPAGPKSNFARRLTAIEAGAFAGMQSLGIGALLGLADWREDIFYTGLHALYLQRKYWRSHVSISFPRMRQATGGIHPDFQVDDASLVQMICALRLILPDAGLVLSTRESAILRDHLLPLGITRMSAASVTEPGGYTANQHSGEQFKVQDHRSLAAMTKAVKAKGFDPVFKDWDEAYRAAVGD